MTLALVDKPVITARCAWQAVEGEAIVIDLDTRKVMGLNKTASLVWSRMDGQRTVADLVGLVAQQFAVEEPIARADVMTFLSSMKDRGLVDVSP